MSTTTDSAECEPASYVTLLDWPEIHVSVGRRWDRLGSGIENYYLSPTRLDLRYNGWPEELLAAGVITAAMTVPPGKGRHYHDPNGRNVRIAREWRERKEGQAQRYLFVERYLHLEELPMWPCALEALAVCDRRTAWEHARDGPLWHLAPPDNTVKEPLLAAGGKVMSAPDQREVPKAPYLRLVIDNTRPKVRL